MDCLSQNVLFFTIETFAEMLAVNNQYSMAGNLIQINQRFRFFFQNARTSLQRNKLAFGLGVQGHRRRVLS